MAGLWNNMLQADEEEDPNRQPEDPTGAEAIEAFVRAQQNQDPSQPTRGVATTPQAANMAKVQASREQIANLMAQQQGGVQNLQALVDKYQKAPQQMDLSPLLGYVDSISGTQTSKSYKAPESKEEKAMNLIKLNQLVNKEREAPIKDAERQYASDNSAESKYYRTLSSQLNATPKAQKELDDAVMFKRGTNPQISQSINVLRRGTSAIKLIDSVDQMAKLMPESGKGPTPPEMSNVATALAGMVSGGNVVTNEKLREVLPSNVDMSVAGITSFLLSEPRGADQQKFLRRMRYEIAAEQSGARHTLHSYINASGELKRGTLSDSDIEHRTKAGHKFIDEGYYNPDQDEKVKPLGAQAKAITPDQLKAYATKYGLTPEKAAATLEKGGYKVSK